MKRIIGAALVPLAILLLSAGCSSSKPIDSKALASELSYQIPPMPSGRSHNCRIKDGKIYINCYIEITHSGEAPLNFFIKGDFAVGQQRGLLKDRYIYAYIGNLDEIDVYDNDFFDLHRKLFTMDRNTNWRKRLKDYSSYQVVFIGDYGGKDIKQDSLISLMPAAVEFEIQDIPSVTDIPGVKP